MKWMSEDNFAYFWSKLKALLNGKVDKVPGKQLSTEDYTTAEKTKLAGIDMSTKKNVQSAKSSPTASGSDIAFIDTISQNANGEITATRKNVREASASQSGVVSTGTQTIAGNKTMTGSLTFDNVANAIRFKNAQNDYAMIRFAGGTDQWGHGLIMGGGGMVVIGAGESSEAIASGKSAGIEDTYIGADGEVFVYTNVNGGMSSAKTYTFGSSGTFYSQYLDLRGGASATMTASSTNPKITFSENGSQPVHIIYSDYDSYRAPAGLKVVGGASASPAWFEVEGEVYATSSNISLSSYRSTSYTKSAAGYLRRNAGLVVGGGYVVTNVTLSHNSSSNGLFTLPAGWRPKEVVYGVGMCTTSGTGVTMHIETGGAVKFTSKWGNIASGAEIHFMIAYATT